MQQNVSTLETRLLGALRMECIGECSAGNYCRRRFRSFERERGVLAAARRQHVQHSGVVVTKDYKS